VTFSSDGPAGRSRRSSPGKAAWSDHRRRRCGRCAVSCGRRRAALYHRRRVVSVKMRTLVLGSLLRSREVRPHPRGGGGGKIVTIHPTAATGSVGLIGTDSPSRSMSK
jgi:hypothetical protein